MKGMKNTKALSRKCDHCGFGGETYYYLQGIGENGGTKKMRVCYGCIRFNISDIVTT